MYQGCVEGVSRVFQGFSGLIQGGFKRVSMKGCSRMFQGCFEHVSKEFQECFKDVSRMFQGSFKGVSRVFEVSFKGV